MKFKLNLNESLFDDELDSFLTKDSPSDIEDIDDDFSEYIPDDHSSENVLPGPAEGSDTGVASEIISLINDEWEAIEGYNNAIASLRYALQENPFYESAIAVLEEISAEENRHVGQLQEVLKQISPNAADIQKGAQEAKSQLGLVGGVLPVQTWETKPDATNNKNVIDDTCTLCDVDDEM